MSGSSTLRSALQAKFDTSYVVAAGAGFIAKVSPIIDFRDSLSYHISVLNYHQTIAAPISVKWFSDRALLVLIKEQSWNVPPGSGDALRLNGPCWGPWCQITLSVPQQGGSTTQADLWVFGRNLVLFGDTAEHDQATLNQPTSPTLGPMVGTDLRNAFPNRLDMAFRTQRVPVVAEAAEAMTQLQGPAYSAGTSTTYTVPTRQRLRIEQISFMLAAGAAQDTSFFIRLTTPVTGNLIRKLNARLGAAGHIVLPFVFPNGLEFPAGTVLGWSTSSSAAAGGMAVDVNGFLYDEG